MAKKTDIKEAHFDVHIGLKDHNWSSSTLDEMKRIAVENASKRSPQRIMRNRLLAIRYRMEAYTEKIDGVSGEIVYIQTFVTEHLNILNISFNKFAKALDTDASNLNKYLNGQRKFNSIWAVKIGNFFHTPPEIWLKIEMKNELIRIQSEKKVTTYKKYDYEKVLRKE